MNTIVIDFTSKQCKQEQHKECSDNWNGFGFEIICICKCHKKELMLDENRNLSNTKNSPTCRKGEYNV